MNGKGDVLIGRGFISEWTKGRTGVQKQVVGEKSRQVFLDKVGCGPGGVTEIGDVKENWWS